MFAIQLCQFETNNKSGAFTDGSFEKFKVFVRKRAVFPAKPSSTRYRQRPLFRGGIKIAFEVTIKLTKSKCTKALH